MRTFIEIIIGATVWNQSKQGASLLGVPNAFEDTGKKMEHHMKFID